MSVLFFSIIIPTFKINTYIRDEALPAIDAQTYRDFEVFVLPDNDHPIHKKLKKQYSWLHIIPTNMKRKPGDKRDHATEIAKGDIFAFIDDDVHPLPDWLENAAAIFKKRNDIVALGGPGIIPENVNTWERIFDAVLTSMLGSGKYSYRFTPQAEQLVDDYPAMNLMIRRNVFKLIGGFSNQYWPGEDSKLLNRLGKNKEYRILYNPTVQVHHHRRNSLKGHLEQHKNYGLTRGKFFAQGDKNSTNFFYLTPAFFTLYIIGLVVMIIMQIFIDIPVYIKIFFYTPFSLYLLILFFIATKAFLRTKKLFISMGTMVVIPLTHLTYGIYFIKGFFSEIQHPTSNV